MQWTMKALWVGLILMPWAALAGPMMYVPTGEANDIVVIDLSNDKVVDRIPELENAHGLSASPASDYLVAGSMQIADTGKPPVSKPAAVSEAEHQAHHADTPGKATPSLISIVRIKDGHVIRRVAVRGLTHHTAMSPDGKIAVAVHSSAGGISVIDLDKMALVKIMQTGARPSYAVFGANGKRLYISNAGADMVSEIDTDNWSVIRELAVGKEPDHIVLSPDHTMMYTANVGDGTVSVINLSSGKLVNTYSVGKEPHGLDLSGDGLWLFVSSKGAGTFVRIDLMKGETKTVELQPAPYHVAYINALQKLYVSSRAAPKIWIIDPVTMNVRGEIDISKGVAHQMVIR